MLYDYKAVTRRGRHVRGTMDALNLLDLESRLKRLQQDLIWGRATRHSKLYGKRRIPRRQLIDFCFQLEQTYRAGIPILEGLADLRDTLEHVAFRELVAALEESIAGGKTLSEAIAPYPQVFNPVFASLIRAGEIAGKLPEVLARLADALKWEDELAAHVRRILIYPAFVATTLGASMLFLMLHLVPQLKLFLNTMDHALPFHTHALFFLSDALLNYGHLLLLVPIVIVIALRAALRGSPLLRFRLDRLKLRVPMAGEVLQKIILSRFAATFAMLYGAGIPILDALHTLREGTGNRAVRQSIEEAEQSIQDGLSLAAAFHNTRLFPALVIRMLRVGESTGNLDAALLNVSHFYHRDVRDSADRLQAMAEPVLTLTLGFLVGWIMLSVMSPIYQAISRVPM